MSEELHATAVKAAVNAAIAPVVCYDVDEIPSPRPDNYVEVTLSRRYGAERVMTGHRSTTGWRVTTRYVTRTVTNARDLRATICAALDEQRLTVDGALTSPIELETSTPIGSDDSWFTGLDVFTYIH